MPGISRLRFLLCTALCAAGTLGIASAAPAAAAAPASGWALLASPVGSGALLTIGLFGLLLEMQTMHGIAGVAALAALVLFFASHIATGESGWLAVAIAVIGIFGILWELHVVPGHGAPGIGGVVLLLASIVLAFGLPAVFVAVQTIAVAIVLTIVLFYLTTRFVPQNAWMARLTFAAAQGGDYVTSSDYSMLLGKIGTASSYLRPAGVATVDGARVDVLTHGEFISQGTPIRVTRVEGSRIFVEPIPLPSFKE